jgi:hypothetical protein
VLVVREGYLDERATLPPLHEVEGRAARTIEGSQASNELESKKVLACTNIKAVFH